MMLKSVPPASDQHAVCGQAHTVLENLFRTQTLPQSLSLSIEEILENAWEQAYRRQLSGFDSTVIALSIASAKRRRTGLKQ